MRRSAPPIRRLRWTPRKSATSSRRCSTAARLRCRGSTRRSRSAPGRRALGPTTAQGQGADLIIAASADLAETSLDARLTLSGPAIGEGSATTRPEILVLLKGPAGAPKRTVDVSTLSGFLMLRSVERQSRQIDTIEAERREAERREAERKEAERKEANGKKLNGARRRRDPLRRRRPPRFRCRRFRRMSLRRRSWRRSARRARVRRCRRFERRPRQIVHRRCRRR